MMDIFPNMNVDDIIVFDYFVFVGSIFLDECALNESLLQILMKKIYCTLNIHTAFHQLYITNLFLLYPSI